VKCEGNQHTVFVDLAHVSFSIRRVDSQGSYPRLDWKRRMRDCSSTYIHTYIHTYIYTIYLSALQKKMFS